MATPGENPDLKRFTALKAAYFGGDLAAYGAGIAAWQTEAPHDPCRRYLTALVARHELKPRAMWAADYDAGFACGLRRTDIALSGRRWQGQPLAGQSLAIWAEDGLGDFIRHLRHVDAVVGQGARVTLLAPGKVLSLLRACFPDVTVTDDRAMADRCDWHIASGSLDGLLWDARTNPQPGGYLKLRGTAARPPHAGGPLDIGVCSRSLKLSDERNPNYTALASLTPIFETDRYQAHSLQYADDADEIEAADRVFARPVIRYPDRDFFDDLPALAETILAMDMVIATSTLVADLASALGVRTWRFHTRSQAATATSRTADPRPVSEAEADKAWYSPCTSISYREAGESWADFFRNLRAELDEETTA